MKALTQDQANLKTTLERILNKSFEQIEFLIKHSSKIKELTNGAVDVSKIDGFRSALYLIYMAGLNTDILERVSLSQLEMFLDKGVFNEFMCDQSVFMLHVKYNLK